MHEIINKWKNLLIWEFSEPEYTTATLNGINELGGVIARQDETGGVRIIRNDHS